MALTPAQQRIARIDYELSMRNPDHVFRLMTDTQTDVAEKAAVIIPLFEDKPEDEPVDPFTSTLRTAYLTGALH